MGGAGSLFLRRTAEAERYLVPVREELSLAATAEAAGREPAGRRERSGDDAEKTRPVSGEDREGRGCDCGWKQWSCMGCDGGWS